MPFTSLYRVSQLGSALLRKFGSESQVKTSERKNDEGEDVVEITVVKIIQDSTPKSVFTVSKKRISQPGQVLMVVLKDDKLDRGGNAYVQQQVPEDFVDWLIRLQEENESLKARLSESKKEA